jgi:heme/copper-type cytochrome/quinol oxidase subunit 2
LVGFTGWLPYLLELFQLILAHDHIGIIITIVFIIIIIITTITICFMQGIYTNVPETNPVPKQHNVTAILSLLFMVPISLAAVLALMYFYISTFRSMCVVQNLAVFCSSLKS